VEQTNWIWRKNLVPFISLLGAVLRCPFDDDDVSAIEAGIQGTDDEANRWFAYQLGDARHAALRLAQCGGGDEVMIGVEFQGSAEAVETLFLVAQTYELSPRGRR
jgi:hypothetical protein